MFFGVRYLSVQNQLFGWGHFSGCNRHVFHCAVHILFPWGPVIGNFKKRLKPDFFFLKFHPCQTHFWGGSVSGSRQTKEFTPTTRRLRPHWQGAIWGSGVTVGTRSWDPGSILKKRVLRTQDQTHTQRVLTLPPLHQKGVPGSGGWGGGGYEGQNPKNHWGIIFRPKMMILQRVRRLIQHLGVGYTDDPQGPTTHNTQASADT